MSKPTDPIDLEMRAALARAYDISGQLADALALVLLLENEAESVRGRYDVLLDRRNAAKVSA